MPFERTLPSTTDIARHGVYHDTPSAFFARFSQAWDDAAHQVLKLETRQCYDEPDNPFYALLKQGRLQDAIAGITGISDGDVPIYAKIRAKHIDFIRCRPVVLPVCDYLTWEFETYRHSAAAGNRIFCVLRDDLADMFDHVALHDFMVFDRTIAFIHDYDDDGFIRGGWHVTDAQAIGQLICMHGLIKAASTAFPFCLDAMGLN